MLDLINERQNPPRVQIGLFVLVLLLVNIVMDGLPQAVSPLVTQVFLLPFTALFLLSLFYLLHGCTHGPYAIKLERLGSRNLVMSATVFFELLFIILFLYETYHYAEFGYRLLLTPALIVFSTSIVALGLVIGYFARISPGYKLMVLASTYVLGQVLAILSFPLNYLRSDMLPVIYWADRALLSRHNPYQHFYVAERTYDFPYLPGMLLAFAPAQALHLDLRWIATAYVVGAMSLVYWATAERFRSQVVVLIGLFMLSPYLQYRHELYTQGHFFSLVLIFVLMQRRRFAWAAAAFGISMVISQFSWVIFPFFLLNALQRGGWKEVTRMTAIASLATLTFLAPFLSAGAGTIAHNAVGQWDNLARPIARPINLSFWVSYVVRPVQLKWLQLVILSAMFCFCWFRGRCGDLVDTLRWMITALTVFIILNVLVDGYFYLMLLVPLLVYTCVVNGWWTTPRFTELPT